MTSKSSSSFKRGPGRQRKTSAIPKVAVEQEVHAATIQRPQPSLDGLFRLDRIIAGDPAKGIEPLVPISKTTLYALVKDGSFPKPIRLPGVRGSFWRSADVMAFIAAAGGAQ